MTETNYNCSNKQSLISLYSLFFLLIKLFRLSTLLLRLMSVRSELKKLHPLPGCLFSSHSVCPTCLCLCYKTSLEQHRLKIAVNRTMGQAGGELSSAAVNPKGKKEAWVSPVPARGLKPAIRQHSPSSGEDEVGFEACAGIPGFISPRKTLETLHCVWRQ